MDLKSFREDKLKIKTQAAFAELIGVDQSSISRWEKDPDNIPWQVIQTICMKTGATIEEVTGWKKPVPEALNIKDTWEKADFTKHTLTEYISLALEKMDIPEEYKKAYIDELRSGIAFNLVKPKVAIVGRSDTGKSTLINALLGTDKMPTSWTPTTSIAVYIKHVSDKPSFIEEDAWVFTNQVGEETMWDERKLHDEEYCRSWKIAGGGVEILRSFGTRQGENYDKEAGAAVVFIDAPVLKTCDIVDLPGFGTETESDDNITFATAQKADVVIYLSQANGFMRIEDITYLKRNIKGLPVWEKNGENSLAPLSNLFIVASQAHTVSNGNRIQLKEILDVGCTNLLKTVSEDYWLDRKTTSGYDYDNNGYQELRSRFFAYTVDIPDLCEPFHTALTEILEALPSIIDKRTKDFIKNYVESRKVIMANEISKLAGLLSEREKYVGLLEEIEKNELFRTRENDDRKSQIRAEIARLSHESVEEFSSFVAETINVDALVKRLKSQGIKNKKADIELFGSSIQSMIQGKCEKILNQKSEVLSQKTSEFIDSYSSSISHSFEKNDIKIDFDAGWAFASALSTVGLLGGFGTFLASTVYGTVIFAHAGLSFGTSVLAGAFSASVLGPIGIALGLVIAGGLGLVKLFGGGWEKSVAKKIVATFDENNINEQFRTCIKEFWKNTEDAFNKAAAMLDADWDNYVANLRNTVKEYNVPELQHKVEVLKYLSEFFDRIPL